MHKGHQELLEIASKRFNYGNRFVCEISVVRDGKPALTNEELGQRIELFKNAQIPLLLTTTTYFKTKIKFLKNGAFIMGADTYQRIFEQKLGNTDEEIVAFCNQMIEEKNQLMIGGRINKNGDFLEKEDFLAYVPENFKSHVVAVDGFRKDISSTELREQIKLIKEIQGGLDNSKN